MNNEMVGSVATANLSGRMSLQASGMLERLSGDGSRPQLGLTYQLGSTLLIVSLLSGCQLFHQAIYAKKTMVMACVNEAKTQTNGPACAGLARWYGEHPEAE
jgi:hypothetical protein